MSLHYKNVLEEIVERELNKNAESLGVCSCEQCRSDILAATLNRLQPKYVSTEKGALFSSMSAMKGEGFIEVIKALAEAAELVKNNPRH